MQHHEQQLLLQSICSSKVGEFLRESGSISYTYLREQFKKKLRQFGSAHSLCAGSDMVAVNVAVPDCIFKRHRRRRSEGPKDGYLEDSLESSECVSK